MDSVKDLLSDQKKGQDHAQGILCYLFRTALLWRGIGQIVWNKKATKYFEKPHNKDKPVDKGNLNKALIADAMTWGSFMKGVDFLSPVEAVFDITLGWKDKPATTYRIILDPAENEDDPVLNTFEYVETDVFANQKKPVSILARLYRNILYKEGIVDMEQWSKLVDDYIGNPLNGLTSDSGTKGSHASSIRRDSLDTRMSWNSFRRGIKVLNPISESYTLTLYWTKDPKRIEQDPMGSITVCTASFSDPFANGKINERVKKFKAGSC